MSSNGNIGTASFPVTVIPPLLLLLNWQSKKQSLHNLDDNVPQDVKTNLIATLKEISNILNDNNPNNDDESACGKLGALINQVDAAERRGTLTADQADDLRTQAEDIRNVLNC